MPKHITLQQFDKRFSPSEKKIITDEMKYYRLVTGFKSARTEQGLSQDQLAKKANINRTTLSKVESGSQNATIETLLKIAHALKLTLELNLAA